MPVYGSVRRNDAYIAALRAAVEEAYALRIHRCSAAERGFFGETYRLDTDRGALFLKAMYCGAQIPSYLASLTALDRLRQAGVTGISRVVPTRGGALHARFDGAALGLFCFIDGRLCEDLPLHLLFSRLSAVYRVDPSGLLLPRETFGDELAQEFTRRLTDLCGQHAPQLRERLAPQEPLIAGCAARLALFARRCRGLSHRMMITHGDAGGNVILAEDGSFTLVDWDSALLAPVERDAWFHMHDERRMAVIASALATSGVPAPLRSDALAYYAYKTFFYYLCAFLECFAHMDEPSRAALLTQIDALFTGWVMARLRCADQLP